MSGAILPADARILELGTAIIKLNTPRIACHGLAVLTRDQLRILRDAPDQLFDSGECCKANVARVMFDVPRRTACIWKRHECKRLRHWICGSRAKRAWRVGHQLRAAGIRTPCPLAFVVDRRRLWIREFLLTLEIPDACTLRDWLRKLPHLPEAQRQHDRKALIQDIAGQLRLLHNARFDHRDLKASNILVAQSPLAPDVWLLDLDAVRRWPWLPPQRIVQNLARLFVSVSVYSKVSLSDRLRFLVRYLETSRRSSWKVLWRAVALRSQLKIESTRRKGRCLH